MVAVQSTAVAMIKHHAQGQSRTFRGAQAQPAAHPVEAARLFTERGRAESANRTAIRYELNAEQQLNQDRAAAPAAEQPAPWRIAAQTSARTHHERPRHIFRLGWTCALVLASAIEAAQ
jgi:predicted NAD/FAD-binding protein